MVLIYAFTHPLWCGYELDRKGSIDFKQDLPKYAHALHNFLQFPLLTLKSLCLLTFFMFLLKTELFMNLKKYFSKSFFPFFLSFVFMSMYGLRQDFWLNLMALCTFFETNTWFNTCLKFAMWITYSFLSCMLATHFSTLSIFILSGKRSKSLWRSCNLSRWWIGNKFLSSELYFPFYMCLKLCSIIFFYFNKINFLNFLMPVLKKRLFFFAQFLPYL